MSNYVYPRNFSRKELIHSDTASRKGIDNSPVSNEHERNLTLLAYFLQDLRDRLSKHYKREVVIFISSGYRSPDLNAAIGGAKRSAHLIGAAADIRCKGLSVKEVCSFIKNHCSDLLFDQVIDEYDSWVHVGVKQPTTNLQRRQFLQARKVKGKTQYTPIDYFF